jgi:hypothetical protein
MVGLFTPFCTSFTNCSNCFVTQQGSKYMNSFRRFIVLIALTLTVLAGAFTSPVFAQPAQQEATVLADVQQELLQKKGITLSGCSPAKRTVTQLNDTWIGNLMLFKSK